MKYKIELSDAVEVIQEALVRINARSDGVLVLKSAEVNLSTEIENKGGGELKVFVVGLAVAVGNASTNTVSLTLMPPGPGVDEGVSIAKHEDPASALVTMADQIIHAARHAAKVGNPTVKLVHSESSITLDLVVTAQGELTVGTPDAFKELFNVSAQIEYSHTRVAKNSIKLNFH